MYSHKTMKTSKLGPFEQFHRPNRHGMLKQAPNPRSWRLFFDTATKTSTKSEDDDAIESSEAISGDNDVRSNELANLEAVLFIAREPMSTRRLAQLADLPEGSKIKTLLKELNLQYKKQQSAFQVIEVGGGFQLRTRPEFASWLVRMQEVPSIIRLSAPAMETLAVIAYRQPVLRVEIERLRGVQCGELIRQLLDRDLVRIVGRSEELGRPFYYGTTKSFLQVFGLGSLHDLPDRELFSNEQNVVMETESEENGIEHENANDLS